MKTSSPSTGMDAPELPPEFVAHVEVAFQFPLATAYLAPPISNGLDVVLVITPPVVVNVSTLPLPFVSILRPRPEKSATPDDAVLVSVPPNVPLPAVKETVTTCVESVVTTLPKAS